MIMGRRDFRWDGRRLYRKHGSRPLIAIEPDLRHPDMWRVRLPDGQLSDMLNKTRAKDAAEAIIRARLKGYTNTLGASPMRSIGPALETPGPNKHTQKAA